MAIQRRAITKQRRRLGGLAAGWWVLASLLPAAHAEDRALLIGVGKYQMAEANLPGIDLDLNMMQEVAKIMSFRDNQIKVLPDKQATLANVEQAMSSWLTQGVSAEDRVLIYFSGHGTRIPDENGDEDDGADEVLVMHDAAEDYRDGRETLNNVLVDDRFGELLAGIPSRDILILVDACHSGTATKALPITPRAFGDKTAYSKFLYYKGMPKATATKGNFNPEPRTAASPGGNDPYVAIAAARDDQESIATKQGSVFTLGLYEVIRRQAQDQGLMTPSQARQQVEAYILAKVEKEKAFNPQLTGNEALAARPLRISALEGGHGPVWNKVAEAVRRADALTVTLNQSVFGEGDELVITVNIAQPGYLNVVNIGPDDQATVLFPNKHHRDNRLTAGPIAIPTEQMNFELKARDPLGPSLVAAFLSEQPINLYETGNANRDGRGVITDLFSTLSPLGMRSFRVEGKPQSKVAAGMVETHVCRQRSPCP